MFVLRWQWEGQACGSGTEGSGTPQSRRSALREALRVSKSSSPCPSSSPSDFFSSNPQERLQPRDTNILRAACTELASLPRMGCRTQNSGSALTSLASHLGCIRLRFCPHLHCSAFRAELPPAPGARSARGARQTANAVFHTTVLDCPQITSSGVPHDPQSEMPPSPQTTRPSGFGLPPEPSAPSLPTQTLPGRALWALQCLGGCAFPHPFSSVSPGLHECLFSSARFRCHVSGPRALITSAAFIPLLESHELRPLARGENGHHHGCDPYPRTGSPSRGCRLLPSISRVFQRSSLRF